MDWHTVISLIASAITGVILLLLGVISWFLRDRVKDNDTKVARLEDRTRQLEMARVGSDGELKSVAEALRSVGELRTEIAMRYVTRDELAKVMSKIEAVHDDVNALRVAIVQHGNSNSNGDRRSV